MASLFRLFLWRLQLLLKRNTRLLAFTDFGNLLVIIFVKISGFSAKRKNLGAWWVVGGWVGRLVKSDFITHSGSHQSTAWIQNPSSSRVWQYKPSNTPICENHIKPVGFLETYIKMSRYQEKKETYHTSKGASWPE